jgi:hypothetical protein
MVRVGKKMATNITPAVAVPLFQSLMDCWPIGKKPTPPKQESIYKRRIDCLNNLARIQDNLHMADEEYLTVSFAEGKGHENAMKRMEFATKEYRSIWDKCEGIIRPK